MPLSDRSIPRRSSAPPMLQRSRSSPLLMGDRVDPPGIVRHAGEFRTPKRVRHAACCRTPCSPNGVPHIRHRSGTVVVPVGQEVQLKLKFYVLVPVFASGTSQGPPTSSDASEVTGAVHAALAYPLGMLAQPYLSVHSSACATLAGATARLAKCKYPRLLPRSSHRRGADCRSVAERAVAITAAARKIPKAKRAISRTYSAVRMSLPRSTLQEGNALFLGTAPVQLPF